MVGIAFQLIGELASLKTGKSGVSDALVENVVERVFAHEEKKAGVRPAMMKGTGNLTIASGIAYIIAAFMPAAGIDPVAAEFATEALLYIFGAGGTLYGLGHGARSVEKMTGKA